MTEVSGHEAFFHEISARGVTSSKSFLYFAGQLAYANGTGEREGLCDPEGLWHPENPYLNRQIQGPFDLGRSRGKNRVARPNDSNRQSRERWRREAARYM